MTDLEIVNWPELDYPVRVKFIQVETTKRGKLQRYLVFRVQQEQDYHGLMLAGFLNEKNVRYKTDGIGFPEPTGKSYKAYGMGKAEIDTENKKAVFGGRSSHPTYHGLKFHQTDLDEIRRLRPDWRIEEGDVF